MYLLYDVWLILPAWLAEMYPPPQFLQVAAKIPKLSTNPRNELHAEADMHARAWLQLNHVLRPMGYLPAHTPTGTPAMLLMEIAV